MSSKNIENNTQPFDQNVFLFRLSLIEKDKLKIMVETFFMIFGKQYFGSSNAAEDKPINNEEVKLEDKNRGSEIDDYSDLKINDKEERTEITSLETSDIQESEKLDSEKEVTTKKQHECSYCKDTFKKKKNLYKHIESIHAVKKEIPSLQVMTKCYFCEIEFDIGKSNLGLITHLKDYHSDEDVTGVIVALENNETMNVCNICGKQFKNKHILATHTKTIHNELQMKKCDFCDLKVSVGKSNLRLITHLKNIHSNKDSHGIIKALEEEDIKIMCNICGQKFRNKYTLASHIKLNHSDIEMAPCHICGKLIKQHENIIYYHMQSHNDFPCEYCPVVLGSKSSYKAHTAVHLSGSKQFVCDECHLQFDRQQYLIRHKQRIHSAKNNQHINCDICGKMMTTRAKLRYHVNAVHLQEKPFCCDLCEYRTARKDNLTTHRKGKHGIQTNITEIEMKMFPAIHI